MGWHLRPASLLMAAAVLWATLVTGRSSAPSAAGSPPAAAGGEWLYLSNLPWLRADTGSLMTGHEGLPSVDGAFYSGLPIDLGGRSYAKGFGVYTPSEIVYTLEGGFTALRGVIGITDDGLPGAAPAAFLVFLDGALVYESPPMTREAPPIHLDLPLDGVRELRLATQRGAGATRGARAAWADVQVRKPPEGGAAPTEASGFIQAVRARAGELALQRVAARRTWQLRAQERVAVVEAALGGAVPTQGEAPRWAFDAAHGSVTLASSELAVQFGYGGPDHGRITVLDFGQRRLIGEGWSPNLQTAGLGTVRLDRDTGPPEDPKVIASVSDHPVLGQGIRVRAPLRVAGGAALDAVLSVWQDAPVLVVEFEGGPEGLVNLDYLGGGSGLTPAGAGAQYVADLTRLRHVRVADDGLTRRDLVAWGKPVYLWSDEEEWGTLLALLGETPLPPEFSIAIAPGSVAGTVSFGARWPQGETTAAAWPALYVEAVRGLPLQDGFARYRALSAHLYPPPPVPEWFGNQWLSWYVHYMDINEDLLTGEIDFLAEHLGDLGPWHIIVDAGWYVAEGREGADWRQIDREKFPRGLRWLVEHAHARAVRVVLYFNAPGVNARRAEGDWMGLRGLIEAHPDWLIPLRPDRDNEDYLYNFHHPGFRSYLEAVLDDYLLEYGVDGIKLDGLGNAWDSVFYTEEGGAFNLSDRAIAATLDAYRLVFEGARKRRSDVYLESGWVAPAAANSHAHTFRYGDEETVFTRPYPLPGLVEHIDYAAYQQGLLGQRANMGAIYGDPTESVVNRWWLGAALALGTQVSTSIWQGAWTPERLSEYRGFLAAYRPFEGTSAVDDFPEQRAFSIRRGDVTYLGLLNRALGPRELAVGPRVLQTAPGHDLFSFDVERGAVARHRGPFSVTLPAETFRLLVLRDSPGLLWGNCRVGLTDATETALAYRVTGPPTVEGQLRLVAPHPGRLLWDGRPVPPVAEATAQEPRFAYDAAQGLLTLWFPPGGEHDLRVEF